jgi:hypothetical protein
MKIYLVYKNGGLIDTFSNYNSAIVKVHDMLRMDEYVDSIDRGKVSVDVGKDKVFWMYGDDKIYSIVMKKVRP